MEGLHAVPALYGCHIAVSGLAPEERKAVAQLVAELGGVYSTDLNKLCTHLVTLREATDGPLGPKLQFAAKWGIPIVEQAWLEACRRSSMCVDDRAHVLALGAGSRAQIDPRAYDDVALADVLKARDVPAYLDGCHVYLGDGLDDARLSLLKRLILVAGGTRYSDHYVGDITHFVVHNQTLSSRELEQLKKYQHQPVVVHDQWLLACFVARARLEPDVYQVDPSLICRAMSMRGAQLSQATTLGGTSQPRPSMWATKRSAAILTPPAAVTPPPAWAGPPRKSARAGGEAVAIDTPPHSLELEKENVAPAGRRRLFGAVRLFVHDDLLEQHRARLAGLGATLTDAALADYRVYPVVCHAEPRPTGANMVNDVWLSQCMAENRLLAPDDKPFFGPVFARRPVHRAAFPVSLSPTGLVDLEHDYYARLTAALGGTFSGVFGKRNTHLLCKSGGPVRGPKIDFARKIGIPCVTEAWLRACALEGGMLPIDNYLLGASPGALAAVAEEDEASKRSSPRPEHDSTPLPKRSRSEDLGLSSGPAPASSLPAVAVDTPLRRDFNQRLKQVTEDLLPRPDPDRPSLGATQAIAKESLACLLNGLVLSISQRLWHRREELADLVAELGGTFLWTYDASCSHYLHQGNQVEESFREFRVARHSQKHIVSPRWLAACKAEGRRVPECDYPHHQSPHVAAPALLPPPPPPPAAEPDSVPVEVPETYAAQMESGLPGRGRRPPSKLVTYAGPSEADADEPSPAAVEAAAAEAAPVRRCFMLTSLSTSDRTRASRLLADLGATLSTSSTFDRQATHLLIGVVTKSEKYLAACAAGLWILRPDYIAACEKAGRCLPEQDYEWAPSWNDPTSEGPLKAAPRNWRTFLAHHRRRGAFEGWTVMLAVDAKRMAGFRSILEAGDATVFDFTEAERLVPGACTHVIVSSPTMRQRLPQAWIDKISADRVKGIEWIAEHLLNPPL